MCTNLITDTVSNNNTLHKANTLVKHHQDSSRSRAHTLQTSTHRATMRTASRSKDSNTAPQTPICRLKATEASWVL